MIELNKDEVILYEVRKHWFFIVLWALGIIVLSIMPIFVSSVIIYFIEGISVQIASLAVYFYVLWLGILWMIFFIEWTNYRLDIWIVTNHRIIDIDQIGLFSRDIATVRLEDIVDIKFKVHGIVGTFFKYGTLELQTSGMMKEFLIETVFHPEEAKEMIYKAKNENIK